MIIYLLMVLVPAFLAMIELLGRRRLSPQIMFMLATAMLFLMGFRESGGDYYNYLRFFNGIQDQSFGEIIVKTDILYAALNYVISSVGGLFYMVNIICSLIVLIGLYRFARQEPIPMLTWTVASSYFLVVVAMGYTRQGVAIALILWAITELRRGKRYAFLALLVVAVGFHISAVVSFLALPQIFRIRNKGIRWMVSLLLSVVALVGVWTSIGASAVDTLSNYLEDESIISSGALARLSISAAAAAIFLVWGRRLAGGEKALWMIFLLITVASILVYPVHSTVADRIGLYAIPLQLFVFGRLPMLFRKSMQDLIGMLVVALYIVAFAVWMFLGQYSQHYWLPYKNLLLGSIS